jgi:hypothetical protein
MEASFGDGTAVHTDIASPYATHPAWGRISYDQQQTLERHGFDLWKRALSKMPNLRVIVGMGKRWRLLPIDFEEIPLSMILGTTTANGVPPVRYGRWYIDGRELTVYWWNIFWNRTGRGLPPLHDLYRATAEWLARERPSLPFTNSHKTMPTDAGCPARARHWKFSSTQELSAAFVDHFRQHPGESFLSGVEQHLFRWAHASITVETDTLHVCVNADTTRDAALKFAAAVLRGTPPLAIGHTKKGTRKILIGNAKNSKGLYIYETTPKNSGVRS